MTTTAFGQTIPDADSVVTIGGARSGTSNTLVDELLGNTTFLTGVAESDEATSRFASILAELGLTGVHATTSFATAGSAASIQSAITAAAATATVSARHLVIVPPGTYDTDTTITAADYVDVIGQTGNPADVVITTDAAVDTVDIGGKKTMWAFVTINHTGSDDSYCVHADATGLGAEMVLFGVIATNDNKAPVGAGLRGGTSGQAAPQKLWLIDCDLTASAANAAETRQDGLFVHDNGGDGTTPGTTLVLINTRCRSLQATTGPFTSYGFVWKSTNSLPNNKVYIVGGQFEGTTYDLALWDNAGTSGSLGTDFYIDPATYDTVYLPADDRLGSSHGLDIPLPTVRLPARRPIISDWAATPDTPATTTTQELSHVVSGETTISRAMLTSSGVSLGTSGQLRTVHFTARQTEAITSVRLWSGTTAAGATPTLVRIGIYEVSATTGDLTLVASTANDTALFAASNTVYTKALSATWLKKKDQRYALAVLVVSGATIPSTVGAVLASGPAAEFAYSPRLVGLLTGQTDLPASITASSLNAANSVSLIYAALVP